MNHENRPNFVAGIWVGGVVLALMAAIVLLALRLDSRREYVDLPTAQERYRQQGATEASTAAAIAEGSPTLIRVVKAAGKLTSDDPLAPAWKAAPATRVPMLPQNMAMPTSDTMAVSAVSVQAMTDGDKITFRLVWDDAAPDMNVDSGRFCDAVAIQFPLTPGAAPMMGFRNMKVQILHWKALWQKDVDEHFQDVQDLHPNYWADLYWFAEPIADAMTGKAQYSVPGSFANPFSHQWFIAQQSGNSMADFHRKIPVEELVAEGFGTLTHQKQSETTGRGIWRDGKWNVVFTRPLATTDKLDYQFAPGAKGQTAFAVWEGAAGNVGARKQWTNWVDFEVSP